MSAAKITIYTTPTCFYCRTAKALLQRKGLDFQEIDVSRDPDLRRHMTELAHGRRTVPQIFVGERHIGDSDEIHELERRGELDRVLATA